MRVGFDVISPVCRRCGAVQVAEPGFVESLLCHYCVLARGNQPCIVGTGRNECLDQWKVEKCARQATVQCCPSCEQQH